MPDMNAFDLLMRGAAAAQQELAEQGRKRKQAAPSSSGQEKRVRRQHACLVAAEPRPGGAAKPPPPVAAAAAAAAEGRMEGLVVQPSATGVSTSPHSQPWETEHLDHSIQPTAAGWAVLPAAPDSSAAPQPLAALAAPASTQPSGEANSGQAQLDAFRSAFARRSTFPVRQDWDKLLVYDLEATCNRDRTIAPIEIIELSCVVVDVSSQSIQCEYQAYVRPTEHPQLDPFCVDLTGIQQQQVDAAEPLAVVLQQHHAWLQQQGLLDRSLRCIAVTWTEWDLKVAMCTECGWRNLQRQPYLCSWVDLKAAYKRKYKRSDNLKNAVAVAGLIWEGRAHSGLDDARNTARLAIRLMQSIRLRLTDKYEEAPSSSNRGGQGARALLSVGSSQLSDAATASELAAAAAAGAPAAAQERTVGSGKAAGKQQQQQQQQQVLLAPAQQTKKRVQVYDGAGRWTGLCHCGVKAKVRVTKKPGAHHGRQFYSCGKWTINRQHQACGFFLWSEDVPAGSSVPAPRTAPWT